MNAGRCRDHAGPLRHAAGFPGLGLLRVLRPTPAASADGGPSHRAAGCRPGRGPPGCFHVHGRTVRPGRRPAMPLQHRRGYAADLHRGLPTGDITQPGSSPPRIVWRVRAAIQPRSARFELVALLRGVQPLFPHVRLSVSLAEPGPSGSTDPPRRRQGRFHPHPHLRGSGCPQLSPLLRHQAVKVSHLHWVPQRLVPLEVGDPQPVRLVGGDTLRTRPSCTGCPARRVRPRFLANTDQIR
jgi:hypothetical protein